MEDHLRRRIEFLLAEASAERPVRDMAIKMIERSVSNYATIGVTSGTSKVVKKLNVWMSERAYFRACELRSYDEWHDETTNEHEHELVDIWRELCASKGTISAEGAFAMFGKPFVTILLSENDSLRAAKGKDRTKRYELANIRVGKVDGLWARGGRLATPTPPFQPRGVNGDLQCSP